MDEDGSAESGRTRLARGTKPNAVVGADQPTGGANAGGQARAIDARGSGPVPASSAAGGAGRAAESIHEAVEQLIEAQEADEAIAEWMRGGG